MEVPRMGNVVSTKVMARAAVEGKRILFNLSHEWSVYGYLVGMDDFHWYVAEPESGTQGVDVHLIHKTIPCVTITSALLENESENYQKRVKQIGQAFWDRCEKQYLGRAEKGER